VGIIGQSLAKQVPDLDEWGLDVKEIGFLLRMIDNTNHSGKVLELALQSKLKLQAKLEKLIKNKEVI
tara:strand:+ start:88 stop:288 length:201 start_codon:yes stop_codon:yes gene_type:complete